MLAEVDSRFNCLCHAFCLMGNHYPPRRTPCTTLTGSLSRYQKQTRESYRALAETAAVIFWDHGALSVVECWEMTSRGKLTSFSMAVQRKPDEAVVFSWITWPSKEVRDSGMAACHEGSG